MSVSSDPIVLPLCCFPPVSWMKIATQSNVVIDAHENYVKQTYRNRYDLSGVNGVIQLTVPVQGQKGLKIPFNQIRIAGHDWRKSHLATIRSAYGRAAYFEHYFDDINQIFNGKQESLSELNLEILKWIQRSCPEMELNLSESHVENCSMDFRGQFEPSIEWPNFMSYPQVFSDRYPFQNNLSVLDLLMNKGPGMVSYLQKIEFPRSV